MGEYFLGSIVLFGLGVEPRECWCGFGGGLVLIGLGIAVGTCVRR